MVGGAKHRLFVCKNKKIKKIVPFYYFFFLSSVIRSSYEYDIMEFVFLFSLANLAHKKSDILATETKLPSQYCCSASPPRTVLQLPVRTSMIYSSILELYSSTVLEILVLIHFEE